MKDIDFDELDKAVNSLMASTPEPQEQATVASPTEMTANIAAPVSQPATPEPAVSQIIAGGAEPAVASESSTSIPVRQPVAAPRTGGRFMDMVHTSSDMKPRSSTPAPAASREGLSITPRQTNIALTQPTVQPDDGPVAPSSAAPDVMPDPIDTQTPPETVDVASTALDREQNQLEPTSLGSAESPFLTDAKVEKRPLNSGGSTESAAEPVFDLNEDMGQALYGADDSSEPASNEQKGADEPPATPQVPELASDLVAIESNANESDVPIAPTGPASIVQQYTSQPSTGDQSHAAIYDATPEPLSHPAKSKSGWLWVLWVVLLLGVGAGGAFVLYNLGIIP